MLSEEEKRLIAINLLMRLKDNLTLNNVAGVFDEQIEAVDWAIDELTESQYA